ncbi:hypothetical protein AtubIFM55763_004474 [Aspergillus tubingensis]|uniref:Uncharacterized protein n=1 Tax=Aspergillus tubingensis TaxID=5068 RepID=A0A8H3SQI2_ASPTU|nr:ribonuclease III [Aspergillus tubingensis]GFN14007.1 ribonuclease III [Aspergillus tubingensis]GLA65757.1 hypothetical protein AtubIFM54640_007950 [Aspergillus tubingensis]GLA73547.1 hypothetical protein AtubIFM55763_004474 [Aspergillus tubingensis]GLA88369.1 hypothetical protein AtubIFM56815_002820 [Aspergillus tubingensis]GLA94489.1 hypothetical protein AtubIFM57143_001474 [Aspergillus tubingensis]
MSPTNRVPSMRMNPSGARDIPTFIDELAKDEAKNQPKGDSESTFSDASTLQGNEQSSKLKRGLLNKIRSFSQSGKQDAVKE